jgi:putative solute:sodium symporter small subunit
MPSPSAPAGDDPRIQLAARRYWRSNRRLVLLLLTLWAALGPGCGILFAEPLNELHLGGCPLGFWFAQQGAIFGFLLLVLCYAALMARLDRRHRRDLEEIAQDRREERP